MQRAAREDGAQEDREDDEGGVDDELCVRGCSGVEASQGDHALAMTRSDKKQNTGQRRDRTDDLGVISTTL